MKFVFHIEADNGQRISEIKSVEWSRTSLGVMGVLIDAARACQNTEKVFGTPVMDMEVVWRYLDSLVRLHDFHNALYRVYVSLYDHNNPLNQMVGCLLDSMSSIIRATMDKADRTSTGDFDYTKEEGIYQAILDSLYRNVAVPAKQSRMKFVMPASYEEKKGE